MPAEPRNVDEHEKYFFQAPQRIYLPLAKNFDDVIFKPYSMKNKTPFSYELSHSVSSFPTYGDILIHPKLLNVFCNIPNSDSKILRGVTSLEN